jgi:hypothetical protein
VCDGRDEPDIFVAVVAYVVHIADAIALSLADGEGPRSNGLYAPSPAAAGEAKTSQVLLWFCGLSLACVCSLLDCSQARWLILMIKVRNAISIWVTLRPQVLLRVPGTIRG